MQYKEKGCSHILKCMYNKRMYVCVQPVSNFLISRYNDGARDRFARLLNNFDLFELPAK